MPPAYDVLKHLVTATLVTLLVVAAGTVVASGPTEVDPGPRVAKAQAPGDVGGAAEAEPSAEASALPQVRAASQLPPFRIQPAATPLEPEADESETPTPTPVPRPVVDPDRAPDYLPGMMLRPEPEEPDPFTFRIGTFNILGSQHTRGSSRWGPGTTRAGFTAQLIRDRALGVVGMQEVQRDQLGVLQRNLGGYQVWPAASLGNNGIRLQVAFRTDLFELVGTQTITTVFHRQHRPIPILRLRHKETGGEFYVMNVHNSPLGMQGERDSAKTAQIAKLNQLKAEGLPVILMGDMNEKEGFFCRVGAATGMISANGGTTAGGCRMPGAAKIDWILGGGVTFAGYRQDVGGLVSRASDHHFIHADATVAPVVPAQASAD